MESSTGNTPDALLVAVDDTCALIQIQGRGSFKVSPALKDFCQRAVETQERQLVLDMKQCVSMDSTFMGVLAGIALRLKRKDNSRIIMLNMSPQLSSLLETLGLNRIVATGNDMDEELRQKLTKAGDGSEIGNGKVSEKKLADTVLAAHEDLVTLCPANELKFQDVLKYLRNGNQ